MLGNLDNGTIFKKAFTDKVVFEQFIQDVLGFEVHVSKIETEKKFDSKVAQIAFELDIFAETSDNRMVIELQKVEYDYVFDRFLHYFLMLIAEQQVSSLQYKIKRSVYLILVMTKPYEKLLDLNGESLNQEMLITTFHTEDSGKDSIPLFAHKFIALNPNHRHKDTPQAVRDWLDLIYESINNPENPNINRQNFAINKAANLIDMDKLSPEELEEKKKNEMGKEARALYEQIAAEREKGNRIKKAIRSRKLSIEDIAEMFDVTVEYVTSVKQVIENESNK